MNRTYRIDRFECTMPIEELLDNYFDYSCTHTRCMACDLYGRTWSCPPLPMDPETFLRGFRTYHLIVDRIDNSTAADVAEAQSWMFTEKTRFDAEMRELEKLAPPGSYGLAAQECEACRVCSRTLGKPCVHPDIMRFGPETIGIAPVRMVPAKFGFDVVWSDGTSIPPYYLLVAGVLEK